MLLLLLLHAIAISIAAATHSSMREEKDKAGKSHFKSHSFIVGAAAFNDAVCT
jgi:hypothetical protein